MNFNIPILGNDSYSLPYAFTEQGVYMLATVLKSTVAINVSKQIMRTFTKLNNQSVPYFDLIKRLEAKENTKQIGFITK